MAQITMPIMMLTMTGSEEELSDLETAYNDSEGNMDHILRSVLVCTVEDEPRFRQIIDAWIEEGRVQAYEAYTHETDKKKAKRKRKVCYILHVR